MRDWWEGGRWTPDNGSRPENGPEPDLQGFAGLLRNWFFTWEGWEVTKELVS